MYILKSSAWKLRNTVSVVYQGCMPGQCRTWFWRFLSRFSKLTGGDVLFLLQCHSTESCTRIILSRYFSPEFESFFLSGNPVSGPPCDDSISDRGLPVQAVSNARHEHVYFTCAQQVTTSEILFIPFLTHDLE